jgi:hypothetical protein
MNFVTCADCGIPSRAPEEIGTCQRCRQRNAHAVREFHDAAALIGALDLEALATSVVYPFRVPLSNVEAARLARAARPLQVAVRELQLERKGPKRAETSALEVKQWRRGNRK